MRDAPGPIQVEQSHKRVRVMLGGTYVADTTAPLLVWEKPYYPTYYLPVADVPDGVLRPTGETDWSASRGEATLYDVVGARGTAAAAARRYADSPITQIRDHVSFAWRAMDHWFEEDEEVFVHARDPHTRIDILPSSRHLRIEIGDTVVAESHHPTLMFETGLAPRYYMPKTDVKMELLTPSDTVTRCPYKGEAEYWSVMVDGKAHPDLVWSYRAPFRESAPIAGLVAFYDERVDTYLDGRLVDRARARPS
jgi:uncharacterized protein (DUF427 family)